MKIREVIQGWHPLARPNFYHAWGASHGNSTAIAGEAARFARIQGYDYGEQPNRRAQRLASAFLSAISNSPGSPEALYHGFRNTPGRVFRPGEVIELPLVAASGDVDNSASYGITNNPKKIPTVVFEFPPGTPMAGYSKWKKEDAKDFGHTWSEAIVGGRFRIAGVRERRYNEWKDGDLYLIVSLEPVAVFDPSARQWIDRA